MQSVETKSPRPKSFETEPRPETMDTETPKNVFRDRFSRQSLETASLLITFLMWSVAYTKLCSLHAYST